MGLYRNVFAVVFVTGYLALPAAATEPRQATSRAPCFPVVLYTKDFLRQAADEQARLPRNSKLERLLEDYKRMRDIQRTCR